MPSHPETTDNKNTMIGLITVVVIVVVAFFYFSKNSNKVTYQVPEVGRPFLGNKDSSLVLQEFSDFSCPACGSAEPVVKSLIAKYGDKIKFEYKQFPLESIHPNSFAASVASECANDQGKFWEYHDRLFKVNSNDKFTSDNLKTYASEVGLDVNLWQTCVDSGERKTPVKNDQRDGLVLNINSTPSFVLNGSLLKIQSFADLDRIIEMETKSLDKTTNN